jgi:hypothetical protein
MTTAPDPRASRRRFLQAAGACIALPFLPSLFPSRAWGGDPGSDPAAVPPPMRLIFISTPLGFVPNASLVGDKFFVPFSKEGWFPEGEGPGYVLPGIHAALAPYREHFSFIKGVCNHRYRGDPHWGDDVLLTSADTFADKSRALSNEMSCDQVAAGFAGMGGTQVRYPSLALGIPPTMGTTTGGLSWTTNGVPISPMISPVAVFDHLFGKDDLPPAVRLERLQEKKSVLDATLEQIRQLDGTLDAADRRKLDEVLTAVRGVEAGIQREQAWIDIPKPKSACQRLPEELQTVNCVRHPQTMLELAHAAFLTDSTRIITYEGPSVFSELVGTSKHGLNHGGTDECHAWALKNDETWSKQIALLIGRLATSTDHDGTPLVQRTLGAFSSGCWGMNHYLKSLPLLLFGHGGGRIKQGLARQYPEATPLANLWLSMLKTCGVPIDRFGDSTGELDGLTA